MFDYYSYYFTTFIVIWSVIIPIAVGAYRFKHKPAPSKALYYFLLYSGMCDIILSVLNDFGFNTVPGLHFYTVGEFFLLSFFFKLLFNKIKKTRVIYILCGLFIILAAINLAFFQPLYTFSTYTRSLEALLMIAYCFVYFENESRIKQPLRWEKKPNNWFVTGLLAYFGGAFFFFLFSNVITTLPNITQQLIWDIHGVCQTAMYILIAIGYRHERRNG
ncbi:hypothetical protein [Mucilaginibacter myungsuensis]|uniref:Uncharacterized protein n=1 Tax=Mucilaginibacter myungsuensis TaxID=649104 RepID=A0A929KUP0_9SPHI|nr:hypothetical protein [Mucilaginibacter myungsuensis]MBE9661901.1 hypothetical protein [Mucilaginibacter myungsuensis]MDN3599665.1 hypothetical protein [Mucilaginibacter myungsuensis]